MTCHVFHPNVLHYSKLSDSNRSTLPPPHSWPRRLIVLRIPRVLVQIHQNSRISTPTQRNQPTILDIKKPNTLTYLYAPGSATNGPGVPLPPAVILTWEHAR